MIQIAGSNACSLTNGQAYTLTTNSSTTAGGNGGLGKCSINVSILDMRMYICKAYVSNSHIPRSISVTHYTKAFNGFNMPLSNTSNTFTVPMDNRFRISHIVVAFVNISPIHLPKFLYLLLNRLKN